MPVHRTSPQWPRPPVHSPYPTTSAIFDPAALQPLVEAELARMSWESDPATPPAETAPRPSRKFRKVGLPALIGGQALDAISTAVALRRPHTREANPVLGGMNTPGIMATKAGVTLALALLLDKLAKRGESQDNAAMWTGLGIGGAMGGLGARNFTVGKD